MLVHYISRLVIAFIAFYIPSHSFAFQDLLAFNDVTPMHEDFDGITYVRSKGIVQGYADGTYRPDAAINRAEFTKILEESIPDAIMGIGLCNPEPDGQKIFTDVLADETSWYWFFVCMQKGRGIIEGYPDGTFRPSAHINFVEAAKIIYGADHLDERGILTSTTKDNPWFKPFVEYLSIRRAIPTTVTSFDHELTRGEMAEIIYRLRENVQNKYSVSFLELEQGRLHDKPPAPILPTEVASTSSSTPTVIGGMNPQFIEKSFSTFNFLTKRQTNFCNNPLKTLPTKECVEFVAVYSPKVILIPEDDESENIAVAIDIHDAITAEIQRMIKESLEKDSAQAISLAGSTVYALQTYFGSYYYWTSDNDVMTIATLIPCPSFHLPDLKASDALTQRQCSALSEIAKAYLMLYPSDMK